MTDKEQFKAEIGKVKLIIQSNRAQGAFTEGYLIGQESVLEHFENFVNSMQEDPTIPDIVDEHFYEMLGEEPVSEDLDVIAREYAGIPCDAPKDLTYCVHDKKAKYDAVLFGANWKEQQFEKNRLKHCDALTEEQAQMESDFVVQHLKKNNRTPTFIDAIEYGMRLQKQQMMAKAINTEASYTMSVPCICISLPLGVKVGDKVKVIVIKYD